MYNHQSWWLRLALILWDSMISILSFTISGIFRFGDISHFFEATQSGELLIFTFISSFPAFMLSKMYNQFIRRGHLKGMYYIISYNVWMITFLLLYTFSTKNEMSLSRLTFLYFVPINLVLMYVTHTLIKNVVRHIAKGDKGWKTIIITDAANVESITNKTRMNYEWKSKGTSVFMYDGQNIDNVMRHEIPQIEPGVECLDYVIRNPVDEVLVSVSSSRFHSNQMEQLLNDIAGAGVIVSTTIQLPDIDMPYSSKISKLGDTYIASFAARDYDYAELLCKRAMDIIGAILGLLITLIVSLFVAPAIKMDSPGPIFFKHKRVGRNGRIFTMYKFRSMYIDAEARKKELYEKNKMKGLLFKMDNDPRITKVGKFIRKTSIDELPQFLNILLGDMSLVGTRPPTLDEYKQYTGSYKRRLSFRPGLTGIWQTSGRNEIVDFQEVLKMDLDYIQDWSLRLDIKIILKTLKVVLFRKGAV